MVIKGHQVFLTGQGSSMVIKGRQVFLTGQGSSIVIKGNQVFLTGQGSSMVIKGRQVFFTGQGSSMVTKGHPAFLTGHGSSRVGPEDYYLRLYRFGVSVVELRPRLTSPHSVTDVPATCSSADLCIGCAQLLLKALSWGGTESRKIHTFVESLPRGRILRALRARFSCGPATVHLSPLGRRFCMRTSLFVALTSPPYCA